MGNRKQFNNIKMDNKIKEKPFKYSPMIDCNHVKCHACGEAVHVHDSWYYQGKSKNGYQYHLKCLVSKLSDKQLKERFGENWEEYKNANN